MTSVPRHRRKRKIRRTGQHTTPSQVEKVAQTAGKAAPAVVVVGTLATTAPHIGGAVTASPAATAPHVIHAHLADAALPAGQAHATTQAATTQAATTEAVSAHAARGQAAIGGAYSVQAGNTLSGITQRFYGQGANWRSLYAANQSTIKDPNMIYVGEQLRLPRHLPAPAAVPAASGGGTHTTAYTPRHAGSSSDSSAASSQASTTTTASQSGTLSCNGLEALWVSAGGSAAVEVTAASIAMAESGGNQFATGTVGERGYWQINPVNGALSTYDAYGNARAAVSMSGNGTNWSPWTTYTSGAYSGRC
ncbi:MAG: Peptidoglycan-binding protein LysM [Actinomycetia bacterium]|nr:Peptidoglycan-binding protein LysM [Actinomycetes bacterium]